VDVVGVGLIDRSRIDQDRPPSGGLLFFREAIAGRGKNRTVETVVRRLGARAVREDRGAMLHLNDPGHLHPPGRAVHRVRLDTFARRRAFADPAVATRAAGALRSLRLPTTSRLLAWVLMPDHWSGLIEADGAGALAAGVEAIRISIAREVWPRDATLRLWPTHFDSRRVQNDRDLAKAARVILQAPVDAGLSPRRGDYPHWDAVWRPPAQEPQRIAEMSC
jgi:putative transposase